MEKKGFWVAIKSVILGFVGLFFIGLVVFSVLMLYFSATEEESPKIIIEWYKGNYFLQSKSTTANKVGYSLLYDTSEGEEKILPHVYGYRREGDLVYLSAAEGYGLIHAKDLTVDVVLLTEKIPKVETDNMQYHSDLTAFTTEQQEKLLTLPHTLLAYNIVEDKNRTVISIGDGRFQYVCFRQNSKEADSLQVYGLYGNFDEQDTLLDDVTGYSIEKTNGAETMYVTSSYGYAIVDGLSATCRVYFTNPDLAGKDYQEDIHVLEHYEDFTPEERAILEKVEKIDLP